MTKETRALIEVAEAYIAAVNGIVFNPTAQRALKKAISSAKAAEEGVETEPQD